MSPTVALYVSGHGFGHAVRAAEVASALLARGVHVLVRTDAPAWLFPAGVEYVPGAPVDVGVVQHDGLELDIDATRRRWAEFGAPPASCLLPQENSAICGESTGSPDTSFRSVSTLCRSGPWPS